jgi:hypothetical protein
MTVEAVVAVLGCLLLVVLAYLVGRLHGELRRLTGEPAAATGTVQQAPTDGERGADSRSTVVNPLLPPRAETVHVPVITALPTRIDEPDLTVSRVASITVARPLIKVAALSYGLRRALGDERRFRIRYAMRVELRRQRKMRRRRRAGGAPSTGWRS